MDEPLYVERQNFSPLFYGILLATGVSGLLVALPDSAGNVVPARAASGFGMVLLSAVLLNLMCMTIRVLPEEIAIHFGRTIYYYSKHIRLEDIHRVEPVSYRPIRESGGWGIRWGRHEGRNARYFSARGDRAVLLDTAKGLIILGTPDAHKLAGIIQSAKDAA